MAKKALIIYYSWSGTTAKMAKLLQNVINSDLVELTVTANTFSTDMFETNDIAIDQLTTGKFPQLTNILPDLNQYETIFVGGPVWSSRVATPVQVFLKQAKNFKNVIIPFHTSTGTTAGYEDNFKTMLNNHNPTIPKGIDMTAGQLQQTAHAIQELESWYKSLSL